MEKIIPSPKSFTFLIPKSYDIAYLIYHTQKVLFDVCKTYELELEKVNWFYTYLSRSSSNISITISVIDSDSDKKEFVSNTRQIHESWYPIIADIYRIMELDEYSDIVTYMIKL